ncbi:hypothetical protein GLOIN_2v1778046 [Rhizophagus clarus]|uniref:Uncharacterized protein n=1 Tax=Rhizophagus clarus TaxID=94130 RepID=A0A8H3QZK3_9GLOM|nr:hypothetical protein GLOIN_2v1778046 [Rhizophagus clarus]
MLSSRPHPSQRRTPEEYKAELEDDNNNFRDALKSEVEINHQNEKWIKELEKDVPDNEKYISTLEERLVESEEQVEKLRCQIKTISSQKNFPERGNSSDLYNPNIILEMATIAELVNAIDGFLEGAVHRDILKRQIRDATGQIHIKNNNLHQDLRELRRTCD